jgi:hypothetical protein
MVLSIEGSSLVVSKSPENFNACWVLASAYDMQGGYLTTTSQFFIRNVASKLFLTNDLTLADHVDERDLFTFQRVAQGQKKSKILLGETVTLQNSSRQILFTDKSNSLEWLVQKIFETSKDTANSQKAMLTSADNLTKLSLFEIVSFTRQEQEFMMRLMAVKPTFRKYLMKLEVLGRNCVAEFRHLFWRDLDSVNAMSERIRLAVSKIMHMLDQSRNADEFKSRQSNLVGLDFHTLVTEILTTCSGKFEESSPYYVQDTVFREHMETIKLNTLEPCFDLLEKVAQENSMTSKKLYPFAGQLYSIMKLSSKTCSLLTQIYAFVEITSDNVYPLLANWAQKLEPVTMKNIVEQPNFFRMLRNICEVNDKPVERCQNTLMDILKFSYFPLVSAESKPEGFIFVLNAQYKQVVEDMEDGLKAAFCRDGADGSLVAVNLERLSNYESFVKYFQDLLVLIYTLSTNNPRGRAFALSFGLTPHLLLKMAKSHKLHLSLRLSSLFLVDTCYLRERRPHFNNYSNLSYSVEQLSNPKPSPYALVDGDSELTHEIVKFLLGYFLSPEKPEELSNWSEGKQLIYFKATLCVLRSLIKYNHVSEVLYKTLQCVLSYVIVGFNPSSTQNLQDHWLMQFLSDYSKNVKNDLEVRLKLSSVFKKLISVMEMLQNHNQQELLEEALRLSIKHRSLFEASPFNGLPEDEVSAEFYRSINQLLSPDRDLKFLREAKKIYALRAASHGPRSRSKLISEGLKRLLLQESPYKYYLMRVGMLSSEIGPDIRARLLGVAKTIFRSDFYLTQKLSRVDLFVDAALMSLSHRITAQISDYEQTFSQLTSEANIGNSAIISQLALKALDFSNLLSPKSQPASELRYKAQNIMRHKNLHLKVVKTIVTIRGLELNCKFSRRSEIANFNFLLLFIKTNEVNKSAVRANIDLNILDFGVPGVTELTKELVGLSSLSTYDTCSLYKYAIKMLDAHSPKSLVYLTILTENLMTEKTLNSDAQAIISRFLINFLKGVMPLNPSGDNSVIGRVMIVLAQCCTDNLSVSIQVKKLLSREALTELAEATDSPIFLLGLLEILLKAHVKSRQPVETERYSQTVEIMLMISANFFERLIESNLFDELVEEGSYHIAYNKSQPVNLYTEIQDLDPELKAELELWNFLMCHEFGYTSGIVSFLESLVDYAHGLPLGRLQLIVRDLKLIKAKLETSKLGSRYEFGLMISNLHTCIDKVSSYLRLQHPNIIFESVANVAGLTFSKQFKSYLSKPPVTTNLQADLDRTFGNFRGVLGTYLCQQAKKKSVYISQMRDYLLRNPIMKAALTGQLEKTDFEEVNKLLKTMRQSFIEYGDQELYFKLLTELIPEDSKDACATFFKEAILDAVKSVSLRSDYGLALAAARFMETIFSDQPIELLLEFKQTLSDQDLIFDLFGAVLSELKASSKRVHTRAKGKNGKLGGTTSTATFLVLSSSVQAVASLKKRSSREKFVVSMVNVLQLCCDNLNIEFQRYMSDQRASLINSVDLDLVTGIATYIVDISDESDYLLADREAPQMILSCLATLIDFVTGPCPENQLLLGTNVQLMLAMNRLVESSRRSIKPISSQILKSLVKFMLTLFEGNYHAAVSQTVIRFFNLKSLMAEAEYIYSSIFSVNTLSIVQESPVADATEIERCKTCILIGIMWLQLQKDHPTNPIFVESQLGQSDDMLRKISKFIGYVEIKKDSESYFCYFPIPFKMKFLTNHSQSNMVMDVSKDSHKAKLDDFLKAIEEYRFEMQYHQHLSMNFALKYFSSKWKVWSRVAFCMILLLNYFLLVSIEQNDEGVHPEVSVVLFTFVGVCQLVFSLMAYVFHQVEFYPNLLYRSFKQTSEFDVDQFFDVPHNDSIWMRHIKADNQTQPTNYFSKAFKWRYLKLACTDAFTFYYVCYWVASLAAFKWPLCYSVLMLDFMKQQPELVNLLKAITQNLKPLLLTALLGIIWIFVFALMAFLWFWKAYDPEQTMFCNTLFECFLSSLHIGIRNGGGIGDSLTAEEGGFSGFRVVFEMSYWIIVIVILMNVIFGIIIDTFGELRDQRNALKKEIHSNCFICGEARSQIELHSQGWSNHFMCLHSPFAYVAFIAHVSEQPANDCTGIEKYVKNKVEARDTSFFPSSA